MTGIVTFAAMLLVSEIDGITRFESPKKACRGRDCTLPYISQVTLNTWENKDRKTESSQLGNV